MKEAIRYDTIFSIFTFDQLTRKCWHIRLQYEPELFSIALFRLKNFLIIFFFFLFFTNIHSNTIEILMFGLHF